MENGHNEMIEDDILTMEEAIEKGYTHFVEHRSKSLRSFLEVDLDNRHIYIERYYVANSDGIIGTVNNGQGIKIEVIF